MNCEYGKCNNEATTKGYVFTREMEQIKVSACNKHKKNPGFFAEVLPQAIGTTE